jgi:hypothetical protein
MRNFKKQLRSLDRDIRHHTHRYEEAKLKKDSFSMKKHTEAIHLAHDKKAEILIKMNAQYLMEISRLNKELALARNKLRIAIENKDEVGIKRFKKQIDGINKEIADLERSH